MIDLRKTISASNAFTSFPAITAFVATTAFTAIAAFTISIVAPAGVLAADTPTEGSSHAGSAQPKSSQAKSGKVLNGSAQHSQGLNSSVRLISPSSPYPQRAGTAASQFTGRAQYPVRVIYIPNAPVTPFHR